MIKTVKGKVVAGTMVVGLLVTGAVAGASNDSFTSFVNSATDSLFTKVAGWAGYSIQSNADAKKATVEEKVQTEFNRAAGEVGGHFNTKVGEGNTAINNEVTTLMAEITSATNGEIADVNSRIDAEVDTEVAQGKTSLQNAAQAKAQALINAANQIQAAPAH